MLAHHEALFVVQAAAPIGLTGWAAVIGARWYSITHRRAEISDRGVDRADDGSSADRP